MKPQDKQNPGILYIVPTPIGNLEDITLRGLRILKEVDCIAAEDTRHTKKLLNHYDIDSKLISYYREKEAERSETIISLLLQGQNIALVSDAGTPAISDPGAILIQKAHNKNITVVPLPGPSAITTALSASGITHTSFLFLGFLPHKSGQRSKILAQHKDCQHPLVLYESVHRIAGFLQDALETLGDREAILQRELTKKFEEILHSTLSDLACECRDRQNRGEYVIIILPEEKKELSNQQLIELLIYHRDNSNLSLKDVSKKIALDQDVSRSKVYQLALEVWKSK